MNALTIEPDVMERAFHSLTPEDRAEILSVGAAFHRLNLEKRLERSHNKLEAFEVKYHVTLDRLEADGLPDDADYAMHEDYFEWHYWTRVLEQTRKALETLSMLTPALEPA
jgi:hypothetical protein